ncbi:hypothetical protein V3C99_011350 [Haemonchus contortus]
MVTKLECQRLPKVELHAHLNGSISLKTIEKLRCLYGSERSRPTQDTDNSGECLTLKQPTTMNEVFKIFPLIHSLTTSQEALITATKDVIKESSDDGVVYLELRSTPKTTTEMSKEEYVQAVIDGILEASKDTDIITRLLLSIDRRQTLEDAQQTVDIAVADKSGLIVGLELSGDPSVDGRKFIPVLERARASGLKVSVHLAEVSNQLDEVDEFLAFRPDRIGHGTFLHTNEKFVNLVMKHRIPLEICLTSNVMSMTTATVEDSHLKFWRDRMVPFCICTDDKGLMDCDLSSELWKAVEAFNLSIEDLWQASETALEMSFLPKSSIEYKELRDLLERRQMLELNP